MSIKSEEEDLFMIFGEAHCQKCHNGKSFECILVDRSNGAAMGYANIQDERWDRVEILH